VSLAAALWPKSYTPDFLEFGSNLPQLPPLSRCTKPSRAQQMPAGTGEWGSAMRESLDLGMPDTAPYKEWLGVVGSIVVAALVGVILFSGGLLS
jgi:hypothetical protein